MELPFSVRTLPPEAVDILRFYGSRGGTTIHADDIIAGAGLSDRGFGKAIRRLVTRGYLIMEGEQSYRLSDPGRRAVADLLEYDLITPPPQRERGAAPAAEARFVRRHVVLAVPSPLPAEQPVQVFVGVDEAGEDDVVMLPLHLTLRLSMVHGEPEEASVMSLSMENRRAQGVFEVQAGLFTLARLRLDIAQQEADGSESACGGMYVDLPVAGEAGRLEAYGLDILLKDTAADSFDLA